MSSPRPIESIVKEYNDVIFFLIQVLRTKANKTKDEVKMMHVSRLMKRANLLIGISHHELIKLAHNKIISYKDQILARDEDFFLVKNNDELVEGLNNPIEGLDEILDSIKQEYKLCNEDERNLLFDKAKILLKCCIEYKLQSM